MKKTQFGWAVILIIVAVLGILIYKIPTIEVKLGISAFLLIILLLFYKLTIIVDDKYVKFSFGIGLIHGIYALKNIINCTPKSYFPFGWGIRYRPGAIIFNVSGTKAIELELNNKQRKVWIGTNFPDEISHYICSKLENKTQLQR